MRFFTGMSLAGISIISIVLSKYANAKTMLISEMRKIEYV